MHRRRSQSYQVGPFTVRQDVGQSKLWRVFMRGVELYHAETLQDAMNIADRMWTARILIANKAGV